MVSKVFQITQEHQHVRVRFNVNFIDRWDGEALYLLADSGTNPIWTYAYKSCEKIVQQDCETFGVDSCGSKFPDRIGLPVDIQFTHTIDTLSLEFDSTLTRDPCEVSWGLDDLEIYIR